MNSSCRGCGEPNISTPYCPYCGCANNPPPRANVSCDRCYNDIPVPTNFDGWYVKCQRCEHLTSILQRPPPPAAPQRKPAPKQPDMSVRAFGSKGARVIPPEPPEGTIEWADWYADYHFTSSR